MSQQTKSALLVDHFLAALDQADVVHEPFSHLYVQGMFPDDFYVELLENIKAVEAYKPLKHKDAMRADGSSTRHVMPLNDEALAALEERHRQYFDLVREVFAAPDIKRKLFTLLAPGLRDRIGKADVEDVAAYPKSGLFKDASGYKISPHKDVATKLVTTQFYLPPDDSQKSFGTSLYTRNWVGRLAREWNKVASKKVQEFQHLKTFPFVPNSGYAFVVGKKSWHGREEIPVGKGDRMSLMNIYFDRANVPFYDTK